VNERDLLLKVLRGEMPEKTPWFADLSYLYSSLQIKGELDKKYLGDEGYLEFHKDFGAGICFYPPFLWRTEYSGNVVYNETEENGTRECTYNTPIGNISSVQKYSPSTYTWAYTEHFVKSIEDLRVMLYIYENRRYTADYDGFNRIDCLWGENGIATGIAPISVAPLQKLLTRWAGVEKTVELYIDETEEFEEILLRIQDSEDAVFEIIAQSSAQYIEFPENLSSEITGKTLFEKYNMPYYKKRIDRLHKASKFVGIHIDGTLSSCLQLLEKCGFDVAEAVTPTPVGDIDVEKLREVAGKEIVIWGGIPGALFSGRYSEEMFEGYVRRVLDVFKGDARFVLGVADQVPADGLISRVKKVGQIVLEI